MWKYIMYVCRVGGSRGEVHLELISMRLKKDPSFPQQFLAGEHKTKKELISKGSVPNKLKTVMEIKRDFSHRVSHSSDFVPHIRLRSIRQRYLHHRKQSRFPLHTHGLPLCTSRIPSRISPCR